MSATMLLLCALLLPIVNAHVTDLKCRERLHVITPSAWPALSMIDFFGQNLLDQAEIVNVHTYGGVTHAVVHTARKETYLYGSSESKYYHLYGSGITRELVEIRGQRVVDVKFGAASVPFVVILTEDGSVWTMGRNLYGNLAHHDLQKHNVLSRVEGLPYVRQIAVGEYHCVALTRDGRLFSWGRNDNLQLGFNTDGTINSTPQPITLSQETILPKFVCCGAYFCAALADNLKAYTWGGSTKIGRPQNDNGTPGEVLGIPGNQTISKIACGGYHTMALTADGALYGWGNADHGPLLQAPSSALQATALELDGRKVRDMVLGDFITVIRTFSPFAEYFGRYNGTDYRAPELARGMMHGRDLMAKSRYGQETCGSVRLGCRSESAQSSQDGSNSRN